MMENFDFTRISEACIKCGKCIPTCTIHLVNADEATSPRGFIELLGAYQRGELELDKNAKNIFETCFLCTNCTDVCPNDLPTDLIIEQARAKIAKKYGIKWFKKAFFFLLRHRFLMDFFFKLGYFFIPCAFKHLGENTIKSRFPLPIFRNRVFPTLGFKSFLNKYPSFIKHSKKNKPKKVAIFIGCLANYNYTKIGDSLVEILGELQIDVIIPKKQKCCAAPAYFTGDFDTVNALITENLEYFETFIHDVDAILIPEATCSAMVKEDWERFIVNNIGDEKLLQKLHEYLPKIFMATEWLYHQEELLIKLKAKQKSDLLVTYHDPCHARKVQGIFKEPRALLNAGYRTVEMEDPNRCCGFGGVTLQTDKYDYSLKAGQPKAKMIDATKADVVSAECSACRIQLTNALHQYGSNVEFAHPLELIAEALKGEK